VTDADSWHSCTLTDRALLGDSHTVEHPVLGPTSLDHPIHTSLPVQANLGDDLPHPFLRSRPFDSARCLELVIPVGNGNLRSVRGVGSIAVGHTVMPRLGKIGDVEDMVDDGLAGERRDVLASKLDSGGVDIEGDDLAGGVSVGYRGGDETDGTAAAERGQWVR
jgi:hypothetical protein